VLIKRYLTLTKKQCSFKAMSKPYATYATDTNLKAIAHRLDLLRQAVAGDVSQAGWCRQIGVTPQAWANYMAGVGRVNLDVVLRLSEMYGCDANWIYQGSTVAMEHGSARSKSLLNQIRDLQAAEAPSRRKSTTQTAAVA
jgi:hypothetical protein